MKDLIDIHESVILDGTKFTKIKPTDIFKSYVCNIPNSKKAWNKDNKCPTNACYNKMLDSCIEAPKIKLKQTCPKPITDETIKKELKRKLHEATKNQYKEESNKLLSFGSGIVIKQNKEKAQKYLHDHMHKYHKTKDNLSIHSNTS